MIDENDDIWRKITPEMAEAILVETVRTPYQPEVAAWRTVHRKWKWKNSLDKPTGNSTMEKPRQADNKEASQGKETWEVQFLGQEKPALLNFKKGVKLFAGYDKEKNQHGGTFDLFDDEDCVFSAPVSMVQYIRKVEANGDRS